MSDSLRPYRVKLCLLFFQLWLSLSMQCWMVWPKSRERPYKIYWREDFSPFCAKGSANRDLLPQHHILMSIFFQKLVFKNLLIFGCAGSSLRCPGFLQLRPVEPTLCRRARASHCRGFSCFGVWALGMGTLVVVVHRLSCSLACGIFPDQRSNPSPLHWQADS